MKKADPRVDAYIRKAAGFAKPILTHLREIVHEVCPEAGETTKWSMPSFLYNGKILCGMAAFKKHCGFWFWPRGMSAVLRADGRKSAPGMGSFGRITSLEDLPSDKKIAVYIKKAAALNESDAPARPRPKRSARPQAVPEDLAAGLKKNKAASATYEKFSPVNGRNIDWITEAKRNETRQKRLATTLEWLAEGKSSNWKYENC